MAPIEESTIPLPVRELNDKYRFFFQRELTYLRNLPDSRNKIITTVICLNISKIIDNWHKHIAKTTSDKILKIFQIISSKDKCWIYLKWMINLAFFTRETGAK